MAKMYSPNQLDTGWQDYKCDNTKFHSSTYFPVLQNRLPWNLPQVLACSRIVTTSLLPLHPNRKIPFLIFLSTLCLCYCDMPRAACGYFSRSGGSSIHCQQAFGLISLSNSVPRLWPKVRQANRMSQESNLQIQGLPTNGAQHCLYCVQREDRRHGRSNDLAHTCGFHTPEQQHQVLLRSVRLSRFPFSTQSWWRFRAGQARQSYLLSHLEPIITQQ